MVDQRYKDLHRHGHPAPDAGGQVGPGCKDHRHHPRHCFRCRSLQGAGLPEIERKMQKVGNIVNPGKIEKLLINKLNAEPDSK